MPSSSRIDTSVGTVSSTNTQVVQNPTTATVEVVAPVATRLPSRHLNFNKKPKLAFELKELSMKLARMDVAEDSIRNITRAVIGMKNLCSKAMRDNTPENDLELNTRILQYKRSIFKAMDTSFNNMNVLSSSLKLQTDVEQRQKFSIEGLDFSRHQWQSERINLQIGNQLAILEFRPELTHSEQINLFNRSLAYSDLSAERTIYNELFFSAKESVWQQLPRIFRIMGEGHRFPAGQMVPMPIKAKEIDFRQALSQDFKLDKSQLEKLDELIEVAKVSYQNVAQLKMNARVEGTKLSRKFYPSNIDIQSIFAAKIREDKLTSALQIQIGHASLHQNTVLSLLKE